MKLPVNGSYTFSIPEEIAGFGVVAAERARCAEAGSKVDVSSPARSKEVEVLRVRGTAGVSSLRRPPCRVVVSASASRDGPVSRDNTASWGVLKGAVIARCTAGRSGLSLAFWFEVLPAGADGRVSAAESLLVGLANQSIAKIQDLMFRIYGWPSERVRLRMQWRSEKGDAGSSQSLCLFWRFHVEYTLLRLLIPEMKVE